MATIRSRMDHHEKAKSRNDPIAKSHYSMRSCEVVGYEWVRLGEPHAAFIFFLGDSIKSLFPAGCVDLATGRDRKIF